MFKPADTAPDNGFLTSVVPMDPAEYLAAVAANYYISKAVGTAEAAFIPIFAEVNAAPSDQLFLDLHENFTRDDGFVAILNIVLGNNAVILDSFL
jgi:hypothetical protein